MKMWIARDKNGFLFIHANKPQLSKEYGFWDSDYWFVPDEDHPEVTFENSPMEVNSEIDDLGESLQDTLKDMAAYCVMTIMKLKEKDNV